MGHSTAVLARRALLLKDLDEGLAAFGPDAGIGNRQRGDEPLGVGTPRVLQHVLSPARLQHLAAVEHTDTMRQHIHYRKVIGDEEAGEAKLLLQILEEREHLRLHGNVQGRSGLVGDKQLRVEYRGAYSSPKDGP